MKVLIVTHHYLHGNGGGVFASRAFINAFAKIYEDVTLMCPVRENLEPEKITPSVRIIPVPDNRPAAVKFLDLLLFGRFHRYKRAFPRILAEEKFDIIVFDNSYTAGGLARQGRKTGARIITIHHNWQYAYEKSNAKGIIRPVKLMWVSHCEKNAVLDSDINIVLTEQDKETFCRFYNLPPTCRIVVCPPFEYE